jgi:hypothetical protein
MIGGMCSCRVLMMKGHKIADTEDSHDLYRIFSGVFVYFFDFSKFCQFCLGLLIVNIVTG